VESAVATSQPKQYDQALVWLADLRELAERDGQTLAFTEHLGRLRTAHQRKKAFLERLDRAGLTAP
jgi:hypothetical protein